MSMAQSAGLKYFTVWICSHLFFFSPSWLHYIPSLPKGEGNICWGERRRFPLWLLPSHFVFISRPQSVSSQEALGHRKSSVCAPRALGQLFVLLQYQALAQRIKVMVRKAENLTKLTRIPGAPGEDQQDTFHLIHCMSVFWFIENWKLWMCHLKLLKQFFQCTVNSLHFHINTLADVQLSHTERQTSLIGL